MATEYRLIIERDAPFQTEQISLDGRELDYVQRVADSWEGKTSWGNGRGRVERRAVGEWQKVAPSSPFTKPETMSGYPLDPEEQATVDRIAGPPRAAERWRFFRSAAFPILVVIVLAFIVQRLIG